MMPSLSTKTENESIWSKLKSIRQLSATYFTISTCLSDVLHRYSEQTPTENNDCSSSSLDSLRRTLFSSPTSISDESHSSTELLADYSKNLQNALQKNLLNKNIIQNVRRICRSDLFLKRLFTTELNEYYQCLECDCTTSNSINDVIHDVNEIRPRLLIDSTSTTSTCYRCGDQSQQKRITFNKFSSCLALTVNRIDINATDHLRNSQGSIYDLVYVIEFDRTSRSIVNVYQREDDSFIRVDADDNESNRSSSINRDGKFLTLWLIRSNSNSISHSETSLSSPQSTSSSTQNVTTTSTLNTETLVPNQTSSSTTFDFTESLDNDDDFWNSLTQTTTSSNLPNSQLNDTEHTSSHTNDSVSDLYLTLLHGTINKTSPIKSRSEHDRTVNTLVSDVLWPMILDQTNRRSEKKSSSSVATTARSASSVSSVSTGSLQPRRTSLKQLSSTMKSRRIHPYLNTA